MFSFIDTRFIEWIVYYLIYSFTADFSGCNNERAQRLKDTHTLLYLFTSEDYPMLEKEPNNKTLDFFAAYQVWPISQLC